MTAVTQRNGSEADEKTHGYEKAASSVVQPSSVRTMSRGVSKQVVHMYLCEARADGLASQGITGGDVKGARLIDPSGRT